MPLNPLIKFFNCGRLLAKIATTIHLIPLSYSFVMQLFISFYQAQSWVLHQSIWTGPVTFCDKQTSTKDKALSKQRSRWWNRSTEDSQLTFAQEHIRIHVNVEKFSLKRSWRLAERLLYNQDYKKDPYRTRQEGRKNNQVWDVWLFRWRGGIIW